MDHRDRINILFVCLGNICRSPLAEGVFLHKINQRGLAERFHVESAGTGDWHVGEQADPRMRETAQAHGIPLTSKARQLKRSDLDQFDYLICMDESNKRNTLNMGADSHKVHLLLDFELNAPRRDLPDPYYGGGDGFETVYELVESSCDHLIDTLLKEEKV